MEIYKISSFWSLKFRFANNQKFPNRKSYGFLRKTLIPSSPCTMVGYFFSAQWRISIFSSHMFKIQIFNLLLEFFSWLVIIFKRWNKLLNWISNNCDLYWIWHGFVYFGWPIDMIGQNVRPELSLQYGINEKTQSNGKA